MPSLGTEGLISSQAHQSSDDRRPTGKLLLSMGLCPWMKSMCKPFILIMLIRHENDRINFFVLDLGRFIAR